MRFGLSIFVTALLLASNVESRWTPKPGSTWSYGINLHNEDILSRPEQVITIDYEKGADLISKLHSKGKKVICYFSGGTIEPFRDDKDAYYEKGLVVSGKTRWNENWLNFRDTNIYDLIRKRMKRAVRENCDAIEVDNLGAYNHEELTTKFNGKPYTPDDTYKFAVDLSKMAHEEGISIGLKNVATLAPRLINYFDFAVVESCSRSVNVCAYYKDFPKQGKAVFTIHYGNFGSFDSQLSKMVREQKNFGYTCTFNEDDELKHPSFSYNCDTGSKSNTSGSVPKQSSSSHNNDDKAPPAPKNNTPASKDVPKNNNKANTPSTSKSLPNGTKTAPGVVNNAANNGTKTAPGVANNAAAAKGLAPGAKSLAPGATNTTVASTASLGVATATTATTTTAVPVGSAATSAAVLPSNATKSAEEESGSTGKTVAIITVGGVATAAAAFFVVKKAKKYKKSEAITDYNSYYHNDAVINVN